MFVQLGFPCHIRRDATNIWVMIVSSDVPMFMTVRAGL